MHAFCLEPLSHFLFHLKYSVAVWTKYVFHKTSQVALVAKTLPANSGEARDMGLIPGSGRSPGERNCNPLQYSCLGNPIDRGAWQAQWGHKESDTTAYTHILLYLK